MKEKNCPSIRFPGFTDAWEQRKVSDVAEIIGGGTPSTNNSEYWDGDIDWYAPAEIGEQIYVDSSERKITKLGLEKSSAKMLPADKTVLFTSRAGIGKTAILRKPACTNQGFQSMVLNDDTNPYFVFSMTDMIKDKAERVASGSTFAEISGKMLGNLEFMFPSKAEQDKIGAYFEQIDNLITLHQRKCDQIKDLKKCLLQKMFPKEGAKVPEIRFPGFTDAWEQRKLGECLSEITYGFTNPMSDTEKGPWKITAKDIVDGKIDFSSARHTSIIEYDGLTDKSKPIIGDLLLTKDGTLGRTAIVNAENICINQSVALLRFNEICSAQYAKTLLDTPMCQKKMLDDAGGGTIKHIYITKVDKMFIPIPSKKEQERLVSFFDNLDNLITLHQRKCDALKELKRGLLQKMFVN